MWWRNWRKRISRLSILCHRPYRTSGKLPWVKIGKEFMSNICTQWQISRSLDIILNTATLPLLRKETWRRGSRIVHSAWTTLLSHVNNGLKLNWKHVRKNCRMCSCVFGLCLQHHLSHWDVRQNRHHLMMRIMSSQERSFRHIYCMGLDMQSIHGRKCSFRCVGTFW